MIANKRATRRIKVAADENNAAKTNIAQSSKVTVHSVQPTVAAIRSALGDLSNNNRKTGNSKTGKDKLLSGGIEKPAPTIVTQASQRRASINVAAPNQRQSFASRQSISTRPAVRPGRSLSAVLAGATRTISGAPARPLPARARTSIALTQSAQPAPIPDDGMEISDAEAGGADTDLEDDGPEMEIMEETYVPKIDSEDAAEQQVETLVEASPEPEVDEDDWTIASPVTTAKHAAHLEQVRATFKDEIDEWDMTMVSEYSDEIFSYMAKLEVESMANPTYMDGQTEIQWEMRRTLVDWLLQVHLRYHMLPETLWIAVNIVDRFLSKRVVSLVKLQLVGLTAMFIAAKYEEIMAPSVDEFVFMAEAGYTREEILKGERIILTTLEFQISSYCSPYSWVRRISKADDYDIQTRTLCKFLMEVTLLDHRFLRAKPSMLAAIGMFTSKKMLGGEWDDAFVYFSEYTEEQLMPGFQLLVENLVEPSFEQQYVCRKYANKKFLKASVFARDWALHWADARRL